MGPLLVLVCPCFRKKAIVTWKIVSFLCNLDTFLLQNVIVILFVCLVLFVCLFVCLFLFCFV